VVEVRAHFCCEFVSLIIASLSQLLLPSPLTTVTAGIGGTLVDLRIETSFAGR
jgi:hypothetical protein